MVGPSILTWASISVGTSIFSCWGGRGGGGGEVLMLPRGANNFDDVCSTAPPLKQRLGGFPAPSAEGQVKVDGSCHCVSRLSLSQ